MAVGLGGIRREHSAVKDRGGVLVSKISPGVLAPPHEVLTPDEWRARGRERRRSVSRSSHAQWAPPADRPDPVAVLEEQAKTRVPDLIPIRYGRMIASPFAYFRGAAAPRRGTARGTASRTRRGYRPPHVGGQRRLPTGGGSEYPAAASSWPRNTGGRLHLPGHHRRPTTQLRPMAVSSSSRC